MVEQNLAMTENVQMAEQNLAMTENVLNLYYIQKYSLVE